MRTWWEKKKSFFGGLVVGALLLWIGGFTLLGWYWPGTVETAKTAAFNTGQTEAFAKACAIQFQASATPEQLADVVNASYGKGDKVKVVVTSVPGLKDMSNDVLSKCGIIITDAAPK